jgi:hypothetical protein
MPILAMSEAGGQRSEGERRVSNGDDRALEQLDRRVSKMEHSIVDILKLSRELLTLVQDRQPEKREGS